MGSADPGQRGAFAMRWGIVFAGKEAEDSFRRSYVRHSKRLLRIGMALAMLMGIVFLPQDFALAPDRVHWTATLRLLFLVAVPALCIWASMQRRLDRYHTWYVSATILLYYFGVLALLILLEGGESLAGTTAFSNVSLIIIFTFAASTLRFLAACAVSILIVFSYLLAYILFAGSGLAAFLGGAFSNALFLLLVGGFIGYSREVYLRRAYAAEALLKRRYRNLVEGSIQGMVVFRDFRPLYANDALARIMGYDNYAAFLEAGSLLDFYPDGEKEKVRRHVEGLLAGRDVPHVCHASAITHDGRRVWLDHVMMAVDWYGEPAVQCTVIDVTERIRAEAELRHAQKLEALGKLTGGVAHDFNNLLGIIIGNLELAQERLDKDDPLGQLMERSLGAAARGAQLTQRLLAFARKQPLRPKDVDLPALLEDFRDLMERAAGDDVRLHIRAEGDVPLVHIDPGQLENALLNMVINARDAMPDGGEIYIRVHPVSGADGERWACLHIRDTGEGMSPEIREHIFDPFFTTKPEGKGTGLGLSSVHGFVNQSGGRISVDSQPGKGTEFHILLPAARDKRRMSEDQEMALPKGRGEHILLVNGNEEIRRFLALVLRDLGYVVDETGALPEQPPEKVPPGIGYDAVVADVTAPGDVRRLQEGGWTAEEIRRRLLLLCDEDTHLPADGIRLLYKPFQKRALAEALRALLDDAPPQAEPGGNAGLRAGRSSG